MQPLYVIPRNQFFITFVQDTTSKSNMTRLISTIITFFTTCSLTFAQSHYSTYLNDFSPFMQQAESHENCNVHISDKRLIIDNKFSKDIIITDTISTGINKFKFYVRFANLNNQENKHYEYTDLNDNTIKKTSETTHGIVWGYTDEENFYAVLLNCHNSNPHDDLFDNRYMSVNIVKVSNASMTILKTLELNDNVNLYDGYNTLNVEYDGNTTSIAIGNKSLSYIAQYNDIIYAPNTQYGLFAGPAAKVAVERIALRYSPIMKYRLRTDWTLQSLKKHFEQSTDPCEGFWTFFDKELSEDRLKLGGRYTIALVNNGNGYDIIYVDGAKVNNHDWSCGMLKGQISPTQFIDNFSLVWYDAMMKPFVNDVYATIENYALLSLYFPAQKSCIRFAKSIGR